MQLPMICKNCSQRIPGMALYHAHDFEDKCPICGSVGIPASTIHLAVECNLEEAHAELKPISFLGSKSVPRKILCDNSGPIPKHLTTDPKSATCYHCLRRYSQMNDDTPLEN